MKLSKRIYVAVFSTLIIFSGGTSPSFASSTYDITVVASGGSAENSGWTYSSGVITSSTNVSINSSDIVAKIANGNLTIDAGKIVINDNLTTGNANNLILKATGNVIVNPGKTITTAGGSVTLWADSDADSSGGIRIGSDTGGGSTTTGLTTNGGSITLSGGLDPATGYAGFATGESAAYSTYQFGIGIFDATLNASGASGTGGPISVRANCGTGATTTSTKVWCLQIGGQYGSTTKLQTNGTGSISVIGDQSNTASASNSWAVAIPGTLQTESGNVSISGKPNTTYGNARPFSISGKIQSIAGEISILDLTTDTSAANYSGAYINGAKFGKGNLVSSSSNVIISGDKIFFDGAVSVETSGTLTVKPQGSFIRTINNFASISYPFPNFTATGISALTIGKSSDSTNLSIGSTTTIAGDISLYVNNLSIANNLSATNSNLEIVSSGEVTQTARILANNLILNGSGSFTLQNASNNVSTITAGSNVSKVGTVKYTDASGGLTIGQVGSQSGIYSTNIVEIATLDDNLTISSPIVTTKSSGDSLLLYADQGSTANSSGTGNIIFSGSGSMSIESGARALIYSGARSSSTGLVSAVSGESNTLSEVATTTSIPSGLNSTGKYAFFRLKGDQTLTWSPTNTTVSTSASPLTPDSLASSDISGASIAYSILAAGTTNCTVNSTTAVLTFSAEGTCSVRATATATGYNNATIDKTFTISNSVSSGSSNSSSGSSTVSQSPTPEPTTSATAKKAKTTKSKRSDNSSSYPTNIVKPSPSPTVSGPANSTQTITVPKSQFKEFTSAPYPGNGFVTPQPGQIITARNGDIFPSVVTSTSIDTLVQINGNQSIIFYFQDEFGETLPLSIDGVIEIKDASTLYSALTGFAKNAPVEAWIFSGAKRLGGGYTNSTGDFTGQFILNGNIPSGSYTIQINTLDSNGDIITIAFGISKGDTRGIITTGTSWIESLFSIGIVTSFALAVMITLWLIFRRINREKH